MNSTLKPFFGRLIEVLKLTDWMRHLRQTASHLCLIALGIILSLLLLEGSLRLYTAYAAPWQEKAQVEPTIADARLGHRPNPAYPSHDIRGWRNVSALPQADVVALGDSQTYGINAAPNEAWPQRLAVHLRRSVYQMAYGGYGPAHYVPLVDDALALRPKVILAVYYLGNDIYDSYWLVYLTSKIFGKYKRSSSDPILEALATSDPNIRAAIVEVESQDPKDLRFPYLDCYWLPLPGVDPHELLRGPISRPREELEKQVPVSRAGVRRILSQIGYRSLLFKRVWPFVRPRLTFVLGEIPVLREMPAVGDYGPPLCVHYRDGALRTVFSVGYRFLALNDSDPREVEGERISLLAFKHLAEQSRRAGIDFYVVLIPTKETAFRARAEAALPNERLLVDLWQAEARVRRRAMTFFTREGVNVIDTLPALEAMIASGVNPYLENSDGHPVARGYDRIASAIAARLQKDGVWRR